MPLSQRQDIVKHKDDPGDPDEPIGFGSICTRSWSYMWSPLGSALMDRYAWSELFEGYEIVFRSLFGSANMHRIA
jgi:hypothetical protein